MRRFPHDLPQPPTPVAITWLPPEYGGRTKPPTGATYAATTIIEGEPWSVVIDFANDPLAPDFGDACLLDPDAPVFLPRAFFLIEGRRVVGMAVEAL